MLTCTDYADNDMIRDENFMPRQQTIKEGEERERRAEYLDGKFRGDLIIRNEPAVNTK